MPSSLMWCGTMKHYGITYLKFVVEKVEDFDELDRAVA
jgi:hypothetical protein